jgi:uncharacterized protein (TIGR03437 family)
VIICSPQSVSPGSSGSCEIGLTSPAKATYDIVVRSTNTGVVVPATVTIQQGSKGRSFAFTSSKTLSGWSIISAAADGITKSAVVQAATSSGTSAVSAQTILACDSRHVPAGGSTLCEVRYDADESQPPVEFRISSSSESVRVPASITSRPGSGTTRFEVMADEQARQQSVTIEARSSAGNAQESLAVLSSGAPLLQLPGTRTVKAGGRVRFQVSAVDSQDLALTVTGKDLPRGANLDPATGEFSWTPGESDQGSVDLQFSATDAAGQSSTGGVRVNVMSGKPVIVGLRNGAGADALAACSPGARMTLLGTFLTDDQRGSGPVTGRVRVRINGEAAPVPTASQTELDFLCPVSDAGTALNITVEVAGQVSDEYRTTMMETAPGLFSITGKPKSQGLVVHSRGLAAIPRFAMDGSPAVAGDTIRFYATGLNCENSQQNSTLLYFGKGYQPIASIMPSTYAGICEISAVVPEGVVGTGVELFLETLRSDATLLRSNTISLAVDEPIAER